ncbi:hypothetical protein MKY14_30330 [Paenibacillus sp. FSL R5-0887]|jgi:hypothetical protein|uniref:hypothetical protein n=1 Tax=Paenibacillus TaxID=44249 RepID=UPI0015C3201F|nr:hypothetical protein [Paenibacillus odorifer]
MEVRQMAASIQRVFFNKYDTVGQEGILLMEDLTPTHNNLADWEVPIDSDKLYPDIKIQHASMVI